MLHQFPVFETLLKKRRRIWRWFLCTTEGRIVMHGTESSRPAAKYKADRALLLMLLCAPYQSARLNGRDGAGNRAGRSRSNRTPDTKRRRVRQL
jgi:hypothetical protein